MRKTILMILLAVASSSPAAEWVKVSENETAAIYVDPATIGKAGDLVKMWRLLDFKAVKHVPMMRRTCRRRRKRNTTARKSERE